VFRGRVHTLHFVGIGGSGMCGLAEIFLNMGYQVTGSDLQASAVTDRLAQMGAVVHIGHDIAHVGSADVVVVSTAVARSNPEVAGARVPVIRRIEMLAELMRLRYGVAVAGAHGKTTTTSLIGAVLAAAGFDPTVVIGGRLKAFGGNARLGAGEYLVAEADESDGSFLSLLPTYAVITNVDCEHLDYWRGGLPQILDAFAEFAGRVPFYGAAILCMDDANTRTLIPRLRAQGRRVITYGLSPQADVRGRLCAGGFDIFGEQIQLKIPGEHNVVNALAAVALAQEVGVAISDIARALGEFSAPGRRFEDKGRSRGVRVVDDYGHHPAEIRATLQAARSVHDGRVVVLFHPHARPPGGIRRRLRWLRGTARHGHLCGGRGRPRRRERRGSVHANHRGGPPRRTLRWRSRGGDGGVGARGDVRRPRPDARRWGRVAGGGGALGMLRLTRFGLLRGLIAMVGVAGVAAAASYGWDALQASERLRVRTIRYQGGARTPWEALRPYVGALEGQPMLSLELDHVALALRLHPWVRSAHVRRQLPDVLHVLVEEHVPALLIARDEVLLADLQGNLFKVLSSDDPADFPVLTGVPAALFAEDPEAASAIVRDAIAVAHASTGVLGAIHEVGHDSALGWTLVTADGVRLHLGRQPETTRPLATRALARLRELRRAPRDLWLGEGTRVHVRLASISSTGAAQ
jgi:UDP-N-acetylmuramate--alanine ligase